MAEKRMFSRIVAGSDAFRTMSAEAQALYFQLGLEADDDGVVGSPLGVLRACGFERSALDELTDRGFVLLIDGVAAITHWRLQNSIREDRKAPSIYSGVLAQIGVCTNGTYVRRLSGGEDGGENFADSCPPHACGVHDGVGESSVEEDSIILSLERAGARGDYGNVILTDAELERLTALMGEEERDRYIAHLDEYIAQSGKRYASHYAVIAKWWREDKKKRERTASTSPKGSFDTDEFFSAALDKSYGKGG